MCCSRGEVMEPVAVNLPVAGSKISAVLEGLPLLIHPPAMRTLPSCSTVIVGDARDTVALPKEVN